MNSKVILASKNPCLIIVDVQNDFCPGGALAVTGGDEVVAPINSVMSKFPVVVATRDYHPIGHESFASSHSGKTPGDLITLGGLPQMLWPDHCVQGTFGSQFHKDLDISKIDHVFVKGTTPEVDSYSGFMDNDKKIQTGLESYLRSLGVTEVVVCGLATDYCVKATAMDALALGFKVVVLEDAVRGVDIKAGDSARALQEIEAAGGVIANSSDLVTEGVVA